MDVGGGMNNKSNVITLKNWYQVDFRIANPDLIFYPEKVRKIFSIMEELIERKVIDKWFFLQEISKLRVRWRSKNKEETKKEIEAFSKNNNVEIVIKPNPLYDDDSDSHPLKPKKPFSEYGEEDRESFPDKEALEAFVNVMSKATSIVTSVIRIDDNINLKNTIHHCLDDEISLLSLVIQD